MFNNTDPPCPNCATIAQIDLSFDPVTFNTEIGTIGALRKQNDCTTCRNIVECLEVEWFPGSATEMRFMGSDFKGTRLPESIGDEEVVNWKWNRQDVAISVRNRYVVLARVGKSEKMEHEGEEEGEEGKKKSKQTENDDDHDPLLHGIGSLDQEWINMNQVSKWVHFCNENHQGICHTITDPWGIFPHPEHLIMIDVSRRCLVLGNHKDQYIALSYMWGNSSTPPFQTLLANFDTLCQDNAFDLPENHSRLPKVIRDCMVLTELLGCRHLWVDRFCIVQDDLEYKAEQLRSMASIYVNSYVTIMASDGKDDSYGLPGIPATKTPRESPFRVFDFGSGRQAVSRFALQQHNKMYHTRGWTFQEYVVSRRKLSFANNSVSWVCKQAEWNENISKPFQSNQIYFSWIRTVFGPDTSWPNFSLYKELVENYSERNLTVPGDYLNAFGAIISIASRSMKGGILHGLPEMTFDGMLLWLPAEPLHRRKDASGAILRDFPSWSWVGWAGKVRFNFFTDAHNYLFVGDVSQDRKPPWLKIQPTLTWYKCDARSQTKVPICSMFYDYQHRHFRPGEEHHLQSLLPEGTRFRHPIPIPNSPIPPDDNQWSPIITGRTRRMFLRIKDTHDNPPFYPLRCSPYLVDGTGNMVGVAVLNRLEQVSAPISQPIEWICLSAGEADWRVDSMRMFHRLPEVAHFHKECKDDGYHCRYERNECILGQDDMIYRFYNVMGIEWEDGIAYRVALGRVFRHFWDRAPTEEIEVRLR